MTWKYFITNYLNGRIEISADEVLMFLKGVDALFLVGLSNT